MNEPFVCECRCEDFHIAQRFDVTGNILPNPDVRIACLGCGLRYVLINGYWQAAPMNEREGLARFVESL